MQTPLEANGLLAELSPLMTLAELSARLRDQDQVTPALAASYPELYNLAAKSVDNHRNMARMISKGRVAALQTMVKDPGVHIWCMPFAVPAFQMLREGGGYVIGSMCGERDVGVVRFRADNGCYVLTRSVTWLRRHGNDFLMLLPAATTIAHQMGAHGEVTGTDDLPLHSGGVPGRDHAAPLTKRQEKKWRKQQNAREVPAWKQAQDKRRSQLSGANGEWTGKDDVRGSKAASSRRRGEKAQYSKEECPDREALILPTAARVVNGRATCRLCFDFLDRVQLTDAHVFQHGGVAAAAPAPPAAEVEAPAPCAEAEIAGSGAEGAHGEIAIPVATPDAPAPVVESEVIRDTRGRPVSYGPAAPREPWVGPQGGLAGLTSLLLISARAHLRSADLPRPVVPGGGVRAPGRRIPVPPPCPAPPPVEGGTSQYIAYATSALRTVPFVRDALSLVELAWKCGESSLRMAKRLATGPALGSIVRGDLTPVTPAVAGGSPLTAEQELCLRAEASGVSRIFARLFCPHPVMGSGLYRGPKTAGDVRSPEFARVKISEQDVVTMAAAYPPHLTSTVTWKTLAAFFGVGLISGLCGLSAGSCAMLVGLCGSTYSLVSEVCQIKFGTEPLPLSMWRYHPAMVVDWLPTVVDSITMASDHESREVARMNFGPRFSRAVGSLNIPSDVLENFREGSESVVAAKLSARLGFGVRPRL